MLMQSSECREALGARCVALVGAKSRVADHVWHSPIVYANVYKPNARAVLAGNLEVQEASALVDPRYYTGVPGLHADLGYVFRDGKDTVLSVIAERRDERPAGGGGFAHGCFPLHHGFILPSSSNKR